MTVQLRRTPMPARIARLPRGGNGYPIPWFVPTLPDGSRDARLGDQQKWLRAVQDALCWVCGGRLGARLAFVLGPMCTINRTAAEPPMHRDCAEYSVKVCPLLVFPTMPRRRGTPLPAGATEMPGIHDDSNPGGVAIWMTRSFTVFKAPGGPMITVAEPFEVTWWTEGRPATRDEAQALLAAGMSKIETVARQQHASMVEHVRGDPIATAAAHDYLRDGLAYIDRQFTAACGWLPAR